MKKFLSILIFLFCQIIVWGQSIQHIVQSGETIESIAQKYGVDKADLISLNPTARNFIFVGQTISIPDRTGQTVNPIQFSQPEADSPDLNEIYIQYNPINNLVKATGGGGHDYTDKYNGFSIGYHRYFEFYSDLYAVTGLGITYAASNSTTDAGAGITLISNHKLMSVKLPVNILYRYNVPGTELNIEPFAGLQVKCNVLGTLEMDFTGFDSQQSKSDFLFYLRTLGIDIGTSDLLASKAWKRFQLAWQGGFNVTYHSFLAGFSIGTDIIKIEKDNHITTVAISLGYRF